LRNEPSEEESIEISRLRAELDDGAQTDEADFSAVASVTDRSTFSDEFTFDDDHVKGALDALLVMLVMLRSSETHGKQLIEDLDEQFDTALSPGTVYPRLHDLCEDGVLNRRELVRTKEYTIEDPEQARTTLAESARQHLALGLAFRTALEDGIIGEAD
jgi:pyoverdine/dityrosine biosynthesis protein Dit1